MAGSRECRGVAGGGGSGGGGSQICGGLRNAGAGFEEGELGMGIGGRGEEEERVGVAGRGRWPAWLAGFTFLFLFLALQNGFAGERESALRVRKGSCKMELSKYFHYANKEKKE